MATLTGVDHACQETNGFLFHGLLCDKKRNASVALAHDDLGIDKLAR